MTLAHLLNECPDALEADFQRVYGLDLGGLWRGEMTIRRAAALAANLPAGSMVWVATNHDAEWPQDHYILAALFDRMGTKDSKPYPRPADRRKQVAHDDRARLMAERFAAKQKRRSGPRPSRRYAT